MQVQELFCVVYHPCYGEQGFRAYSCSDPYLVQHAGMGQVLQDRFHSLDSAREAAALLCRDPQSAHEALARAWRAFAGV